MAQKKDLYKILGISKDADAAAIKKAYRKLAKKYHPDTNKGNTSAEEKFKEISEAYEILGDKEKRKLYDQYGMIAFTEGFDPERYQQAYRAYNGRNGFGGFENYGGFGGYQGFTGAHDRFHGSTGAHGGFHGFDGTYGRFHGFDGTPGGNTSYSYRSSGGPDGYQEFHFSGSDVNMDDILKDLFGSGYAGEKSGGQRSSYYSGGGSAGEFSGSRGRQPVKGQDINADIRITFDEAVSGCDKIISWQDEQGTKQSLKVHIPAGIDTGKKIRLAGKGTSGSVGGPAGDLYLKVQVSPRPGFERKGQDVYTTAQIPYTTAVFGGEAIVPTLNGQVSCKIKAGTQSGSKVRLKGKGIPHMNHPSLKGDLYVTIQIEVPRTLNPEAERKLREYQKAV